MSGPLFRGELQLLRRSDTKSRREWLWVCKCFCGAEFLNLKHQVVSGHVKSCGCTRHSSVAAAVTTHGHTAGGSASRTYQTWVNMTNRCGNPNVRSFADYGARGIVVCERWTTFDNFLADMGERPDGMTLERDDSDGNYEPSNCRWATVIEQANNKRNNVGAVVDGKWVSVAVIAANAGVRRRTMEARLRSSGQLVRKGGLNG